MGNFEQEGTEEMESKFSVSSVHSLYTLQVRFRKDQPRQTIGQLETIEMGLVMLEIRAIPSEQLSASYLLSIHLHGFSCNHKSKNDCFLIPELCWDRLLLRLALRVNLCHP